MALQSTLTQTLIVNPAFLQEIKDCNPDLWETVEGLRRVCYQDAEPAQVSRGLTRLLNGLRDQLALQFSLEESYGYMAVEQPTSRVLAELASRTQSQHGMLYMQLSDLAEQAEELQYRGVEVRQLHQLVQRTIAFDEDLREHERTENELIQRSFDLS